MPYHAVVAVPTSPRLRFRQRYKNYLPPSTPLVHNIPAGRVGASCSRHPCGEKRVSEIAQSRWVRQIIAWGLRRAVRLARMGRAHLSLRIALRLAKLAPTIPLLHFYLAKIALSLGDTDTAGRALHAAVDSGQLNKIKYYCHAVKLFLELYNLDAAGRCLEEAKRAYPTSRRVWVLLGELCRIRGSTGDAVCCFETALTLASSRNDQLMALNGLAGCFADTAQGRRQEALQPHD